MKNQRDKGAEGAAGVDSDHEAAQYRQERYPRRGERLASPALLLALLLLAGLTVLLPEGREDVPT